MFRSLLLIIFSSFFILAIDSSDALSESSVPASISLDSAKRSPGFEVTPGLQGAVEFWVVIFSKYGENEVVFHHRDYPNIIYSVLDFGDLKSGLFEKLYRKRRKAEVKKEAERIRKALKNLSRGNAPSNELETRIEELFKSVPGKNKYKTAMAPKQVRGQSGIKEKFKNAIERSGRYMPSIEHVFRSEGLPIELTRLPFVESSFNYEAYSSVGAAGIWQFIRSTGKLYMRINSYMDERRDPIIATRSAAKYLSKAYDALGVWPLAVTAYNHGTHGMKRAVNQTGSTDIVRIIKKYKSRTFGFASKNFYPELLAANYVYDNRRTLFPDALPEPAWQFDEILLEKSISFKTLVSLQGGDRDRLADLNRGFKNPILNGSRRIPAGVFVKVPKGSGKQVVAGLDNARMLSASAAKETFEKKVGEIRKFNKGGIYRVRRGDTLGKIASRHGVSQRTIMSANGIRRANRIYVGQKLRIPGTSVGGGSTSRKRVASNRGTSTYKVRGGDTLGKIAQKHRMSLGALLSLNGLSKRSVIRPGDRLKVSGGSAGQGRSGGRSYTVRRGDSLFSIAKRVGISLGKLRSTNPKVGSMIKPGQVLVLP